MKTALELGRVLDAVDWNKIARAIQRMAILLRGFPRVYDNDLRKKPSTTHRRKSSGMVGLVAKRCALHATATRRSSFILLRWQIRDRTVLLSGVLKRIADIVRADEGMA